MSYRQCGKDVREKKKQANRWIERKRVGKIIKIGDRK